MLEVWKLSMTLNTKEKLKLYILDMINMKSVFSIYLKVIFGEHSMTRIRLVRPLKTIH